ncbi:MAG: GNAT family N-acetyltransferase [Anaerolineaceae bacterium]|nr:GNAT family N-acetyltransferase [Anaerolineaceae bacterium]
MTKTIYVHDKARIEAFLRRDPILHMFGLGDLDDFYWPYTSWYGLEDNNEIQQLVLTYIDAPNLVLMALTNERPEQMRQLLESIIHLLPKQLYVHLSPGLADVLATAYHLHPHGKFIKMALNNSVGLSKVNTSAGTQLTIEDLPKIERFYQESYPENVFNKRMLQTGQYFGVCQDGRLLGIAGIHVYSPQYRVAVLGNIATHPDFRRQGVATAVTARLCQSLKKTVDHIGLLVQADNASAIACYTKLGFVQHSTVEVYSLEGNEPVAWVLRAFRVG